ncbi:MAG: hypothetical protein IAI50_15415 [Candidatus Eremiobacteraeota bacterium]|nr:hypothetical protein [Candidatus Eremiobacteraeota bacterium]
MESRVEKKILGLLDVIALEVTELRGDVTVLRSDVTGLRSEMVEFRAETSANFNRIERRLDNHETRIEVLEQHQA